MKFKLKAADYTNINKKKQEEIDQNTSEDDVVFEKTK